MAEKEIRKGKGYVAWEFRLNFKVGGYNLVGMEKMNFFKIELKDSLVNLYWAENNKKKGENKYKRVKTLFWKICMPRAYILKGQRI